MTIEERNKTVQDNMVLIDAVINNEFRYFSARDTVLSREDLYQAGCIGLINAASHFDPSRGCQFSTYAYYAIKNAICNELKKLRRVEDTYTENNMMSLDSLVSSSDENLTVTNTVADNATVQEISDWEFRESYMDILNSIKDNEPKITERDVMIFDMQLQGMTPADISDETGLSKDTIYSRAREIKRKIKKDYKSEFDSLLKASALSVL